MAAVGVTVLVVDSDVVELSVGGAVDREDLHGRVLDGLSQRVLSVIANAGRVERDDLPDP